jgi:hypothetical protein
VTKGTDIFERVTNPNYRPKPKPKAEVIEFSEFKQPVDRWDNRITCTQCAYLATNGQCLNSKAAGAIGKYHPKPDIPRRCQGFKAGGI